MTLADALDTEDSLRIALIHARLAAHIRADLIEAKLLVAELLEAQEQYALAAQALEGVPEGSPWYVTAEIRRANTQRGAGDLDAAIATLRALAESHPDQIEVHSALGDMLREAERFPAAAEAYSRAIELIDTPRPAHWVLYYTRGIARERSGDWPAAEADFRQALELEPDQPLVLNYLGYSMVEQRQNLDEALAMIEKAVAGQPDDGYITDSLGWVLYRLGRYEEALPHMLRAVELVPDDAVINDHLGDVLWKVGRRREAEFQWSRALSLGPADDLDMQRIRAKLEGGLDAVLAQEQRADNGG
jgi:Flp pilus assembly protein TadD